MTDWIDRLAQELGEEPLSDQEVARVLGVAREVAHRVERKITPLAALLAGTAVGRRLAAGEDRPAALETAFGTLEALLPQAPSASDPA
jgi:hypothetical protein